MASTHRHRHHQEHPQDMDQHKARRQRLRIAVLCASNQNRSMEAHNVLAREGFDVRSFGTGSAVRLPGPAADRPNIYAFGTPYDDIYNDLVQKDPQLYTQNGLLAMLDRNRRIKHAPERFQDSHEAFDLVVTCEERCFDAACESILNRPTHTNEPVHLVNVEIRDNHEQAVIGGKHILRLIRMAEKASDLDQDIERLLEEFVDTTRTNILHTVAYF